MSCPSYVLARFLAAAGHIALQQVIHLETSVLGEIKRRERLKEDSKGERKKRNSTTTSVSQTPRNKVNELSKEVQAKLQSRTKSLKTHCKFCGLHKIMIHAMSFQMRIFGRN